MLAIEKLIYSSGHTEGERHLIWTDTFSSFLLLDFNINGGLNLNLFPECDSLYVK